METIDLLRANIARQASALTEEILKIPTAMQRNGEDWFIKTGWKRFNARYFAAAALVINVLIPAGLVVLDDDATSESLIDLVASTQANVWVGMSYSWSQTIEPERTLEGDFAHYLEPDVIYPLAAERFMSNTANLSTNMHAPMKFCISAICASLFALLEQPNPQKKEWAAQVVEPEFELLVLGDAAPPNLSQSTKYQNRMPGLDFAGEDWLL